MKKIFLFFSLSMTISFLFSQRILSPLQFKFNQANLNPAYNGTRKELTLSAIINNRPSAFNNKSSYKSFQIDTPIRFYSMGLGFAVEQSTIGVHEVSSFKLAYSYKIRFLEGMLSLGTFLGVNQYKFDFSSQTINSLTDPTLATNSSTINPLATTGIYYQNKRLAIGFSIDNLIRNNLSLNSTSSNSKSAKNYFVFAETKHRLSERLTLKPSLQIHKTKQIPIDIFLATILDLNDKLWLSGGYRLNSELSFSAGLNLSQLIQGFSQPIKLGAAYSIPQNHEVLLQNSFEVFISYAYLKRPNPEKIKNQKRITSPIIFY